MDSACFIRISYVKIIDSEKGILTVWSMFSCLPPGIHVSDHLLKLINLRFGDFSGRISLPRFITLALRLRCMSSKTVLHINCSLSLFLNQRNTPVSYFIWLHCLCSFFSFKEIFRILGDGHAMLLKEHEVFLLTGLYNSVNFCLDKLVKQVCMF